MKVAIPRSGEFIAPRFDCCATITLFTIEDNQLTHRVDYSLQSQEGFDRVRLLRDQGVDVLICSGIQPVYEDLAQAYGVQTISWLSGRVDELLDQFIKGTLIPGSGRSSPRPFKPK